MAQSGKTFTAHAADTAEVKKKNEDSPIDAIAFIVPDEYRDRPRAASNTVSSSDWTHDLSIVMGDGETTSRELHRVTLTDEESGERYRIGIVHDGTEQLGREEDLQRERAIDRQRDGFDTFNRINDLLLEIIRELFGTPTREEIERIVCEHLADSGLYEFAWIGKPDPDPNPDPDGKRVTPRASAGVDDGYVETIIATTGEIETGQSPGERALRIGKIQVSQDIRTDPAFEHWREAAFDHDVRSAAAVPLVHDGRTYGFLEVYAARPFAFSQREQAAFEVLGEAVGFGIHAIETQRLLFADAVLELEFRLIDTDQFLICYSERLECDLSVEGYVVTKSGGWLLYVGVEGASPTAVCEATQGLDDLKHIRVIRDATNGGLIEYRFSESSLLDTLAEAGVKLRSADATAGIGRFVVEAPQSADVREVVGRVHDIYPTADLLAQRERDRSVTEMSVPDGPFGDLTDRQHETLEIAYHADYFEWPRESTAEEVADSMEIASPTLHRHLRKAQNKMLTEFLDGGPPKSLDHCRLSRPPGQH